MSERSDVMKRGLVSPSVYSPRDFRDSPPMDDKTPRSGLDALFNPRSVAVIGASEDPTPHRRPAVALSEGVRVPGQGLAGQSAPRPGAGDRGAAGHRRGARPDRCRRRGRHRRERPRDHRGVRRVRRESRRGVHIGLRRNGRGRRGPAAAPARDRTFERDAHPGSELSGRVQRRDRILRNLHHHPRHLPPEAGPGRHREPERRLWVAPGSARAPAPHRRRALGEHRQRVRRDRVRVHRLDGGTSRHRGGGGLRGGDWRRAMPCSPRSTRHGRAASGCSSPRPGAPRQGPRPYAPHTAALAGADAVFDAMLSQAGILRTDSTEEMLDAAYAASFGALPSSRRIGLMTISGGAGVMMADEAAVQGLEVAPMPEEAQRRLKEKLSFCTPRNPRRHHRAGVQRAPSRRRVPRRDARRGRLWGGRPLLHLRRVGRVHGEASGGSDRPRARTSSAPVDPLVDGRPPTRRSPLTRR